MSLSWVFCVPHFYPVPSLALKTQPRKVVPEIRHSQSFKFPEAKNFHCKNAGGREFRDPGTIKLIGRVLALSPCLEGEEGRVSGMKRG